MPRTNHFRELLRSGKPTVGTRIQSSNPTSIELIGRSGKFDYVEFLAEYAPYDLYSFDNMGRAIELFPNFSGLIKMERSDQHHLVVRAMGAGIENLLFTDVRTAEDAKECVLMVKPETPDYPGSSHGNAGGRAAAGGAEAVIKSYEDAVIALMVEKKEAVENLEKICQVKGVDMVQFGPSDYSWSMGIAGQRDAAQVVEAREHTIKVALKNGVRPRAEISSAAEVEYYQKLGVKDFNISTDSGILSAFYRDQGKAIRDMLSAVTA